VQLGPASIQPSEFAKFTVVVWVAMLAAKKGDLVREFKRGLLPFLIVTLPVVGLIVLEPDLSSGTVVLLLAGIVVFTAGAKIGHFLVIGVMALPLVWHEVATVQYRLQRMVSFLSSGDDLAEASWQIQQSLVGFGAGEFLGTGFGQGLQKLGYLPYAYSDFIFSTIGEEWGFLGVVVLVGLFAVYLILGFRIARTAPDLFGTLLATGLTSAIGIAAILHMAVTLHLVPTTGISLPFISYGRSSLLVSLLATGVLIGIGSRRGSAR
jgi:cell division protein FtsW